MPAPERLPQLWADNKLALLEFVRTAHIGIKGVVRDALSGEPIPNAVVWVRNVSGTEAGAEGGEAAIKHPVTTCEWTGTHSGRGEHTHSARGECEGQRSQGLAQLAGPDQFFKASHHQILIGNVFLGKCGDRKEPRAQENFQAPNDFVFDHV